MKAYYQNEITKTPTENLAQDFENCLNDLKANYIEKKGKALIGIGRMLGSINKNGHKAYLISSIAKGPRGGMVDFIIEHKLYHLLDEACVLRHANVFSDSPETIKKAQTIMRSIMGS